MVDVAHIARAEKQKALKKQIQKQAFAMALTKLKAYQFNDSLQTTALYQQIDDELATKFASFNQYRIARQGFLQAVRHYNQIHDCELDEPVVPILEGRDKLTIDYDWFVQGTKVSESFAMMLTIWQKKRKFTANECVMYLLYSSIMMGGLNDINALKALYNWLFGERTLYQINLNYDENQNKPLAVIPLTVFDERYGCISHDNKFLTRFVNYVPDTSSLMFLYTLKDIDLNKRKVSKFETLIKHLNNQFDLTIRDPNKPHLSHLIKYANFHWRNLPQSAIDGAGSMVMQGEVKTTALPFNKLVNYNQETINVKLSQEVNFNWGLLFEYQTSRLQSLKEPKQYPAFSKNIIKSIQDALKQSKPKAKEYIEALLKVFPQPNAMRLLEWTVSLIDDGKSNNQTISKYIGAIGRDWLMLTMDEDLSLWQSHDYAQVYEQILQQKRSDGRKDSVLYQDNQDDADVELTIHEIDTLEVEDNDNDASLINHESDATDEIKTLDAESDPPQNKTFIKGRLYAFHEFQKKRYPEDYDAPDLTFGRKDSLQLVKANMISPKVYRAMHEQIQQSSLDDEQKQLCHSIITLAYRTGMRLNELAGIKVSDIEDSQYLSIVLTPNRYRRLKSSSARRRLPINPLLKPHELDALKHLITRQQRANRSYLFSQGTGNVPLPSHFFANLLRILLDTTLGEGNHDYTFHSFRHTAISQLALVVSKSPLAYVMTDYTSDDVEQICQDLLGRHQIQGAWFGLASFVGHLTCDTTFEHYIHTAHLLAGEQLSRAKLAIPLTTWQNITGIDYQRVHYYDKTAYDKTSKTVDLNSLSGYLARKLKAHHYLLFVDNKGVANHISSRETGFTKKSDSNSIKCSIFIHAKYNDAIAFLLELNAIKPEQREAHIDQIGFKHGIDRTEAKQLFENAKRLNTSEQLIIKPRGYKANDLISVAMERAYQMSIDKPENLKKFVGIYQQKHITSNSYLHFGIKKSQHQLLAQFMKLACHIIEAQHWQIRSGSEQAVRELKKKYRLDTKIMTGIRPEFKGFEVRVVMKAKYSKTGEGYFKSSGVLKFVGGVLVCLVGLSFIDGTDNKRH
ncbi:tyrosine-type recombinase/integrase [Psychrobacter sp. I-STPA6b]|uniref:tyrosine-type recombinase/integrase n=1 Tax=Psychrobacter sp. I-STPA6b TaxID=2585718 RepID=UPI001D0CCCA5|nr:tyrosine-type recombinase/integrase [Psychrobacter sp. I-STPA6b]